MIMTERYVVKNIGRKAEDKLIKVTVPGSKSITNRALLLSVLAEGETNLSGVLFSDDSRHFMECVKELGYDTTIDEENKTIRIVSNGTDIPKKKASIYVGSAGTAARFLTALLGISKGEYYIDASEQMRKRPMAPLLKTLQNMGTQIDCKEEEGHFPFTLKTEGVTNSHINVNIDTSSQFLSALLISSPCIGETLTIDVEGNHGMAYIDMTVKMMKQFGIEVENYDNKTFVIKDNQHYVGMDYQIEPDVSGACYFYAMAAITGSSVIVDNVHFDSLQGDIEFIKFLEKMGCEVLETLEGIQVTGPRQGGLKGITADMHSCSDQAITMAAIAPYADSDVKITGIGHIKYQESNRIQAIVDELTKMGIKCEQGDDYIIIHPGKPSPACVSTYDDHRIAMGFSLTGLMADGIVIDDPGCCRKTFENYFEVLDDVIDNQILG